MPFRSLTDRFLSSLTVLNDLKLADLASLPTSHRSGDNRAIYAVHRSERVVFCGGCSNGFLFQHPEYGQSGRSRSDELYRRCAAKFPIDGESACIVIGQEIL
eukprot:744219-Prorocentrum_minimum.AAC.4